MVYASMTHQYIFNYKPERYLLVYCRYWMDNWTQLYNYGPLANGATTVCLRVLLHIPTVLDGGK